MTLLFKAFLGAGSAALLAVGAQAQTVDFGGLSGTNGQAFTGPYVEEGVTVNTVSGQVFEGHVFGNPQPSLVVGSVFGGGNLARIEATKASIFRLRFFDLSAQNGNAGYFVQGFLGAIQMYAFSGSAGSGFATYTGNNAAVDRVRFTLTPTGTSVNIDNIFLGDAVVPEPATWAMLIAGFGMIGYGARRRKLAYTLA